MESLDPEVANPVWRSQSGNRSESGDPSEGDLVLTSPLMGEGQGEGAHQLDMFDRGNRGFSLNSGDFQNLCNPLP